ncbi:uncharacterized membrane protein YcaP (DUF421 family) [Gracilibacillus halotolerans]|uniref:Uncharacterized membrane protein YcaP (DUF421 family) n=1 Tax=Gracilibacillus halotolerans TaxID=74386 RepID=A0A841RLS9_9BACI|nr:DUF421 domain-containing protein [Gracilibacillus halotolerans]MBB6512573.1 uncharacterized membrane protein YcaP (DUF421 family) [Gracilibacillus halotolerans]
MYGSIFIEILFGFVLLFFVAKMLGKTQIKQLTAFDFVSALILGELVGNGLYDDKVGLLEIAYAVFLWGALIYITEIITQKFKGTRKMLEGSPAIVIHKGQLQREIMRKGKLDIHQLLHLLRSKGVFSVREVDYAILERDGSISILHKSSFQNPTKSDLDVPLTPVHLSFSLINDGEIIINNLREIGKDRTWLNNELKKQGFPSVEDVFYAEYIKGQKLLIQGYEDNS